MKVPPQASVLGHHAVLRRNLTGRLIGWALALSTLPAVAQQVPTPSQAVRMDTIRQVVELPAATIDSLAAEPLTEPAVDSARLAWLQTPTTLQELVSDRVSCFETAMPHQFNAAVMAYVRLFTERQRGYTQRVLEREQFYFPLFEKYLAQYHLPAELKYLSVVESALIPTAKSPVGAAGLWQFMPPTASDLHLKRDEWVDERLHPEKATEAACKYLRGLYGIFHDWELVLAAYNWGVGNVQRVIRKTGKRNFWDLYPHMPAETRNYVPTFTAVMYAMTYAKEHELRSPALHYQQYEPLDTLGVRGQAVDLRRLSRALGYADSLALLRYNPELRYPSLPAGYRPYVLRFPVAAREHLGDVDHSTLLAYCQPTTELPRPLAILAPRLEGIEPWPSSQLAAGELRPDNEAAGPHYRRLSHTLRRGQNLATVAEKYNVSAAQLRKWNGLRKDSPLKPGKQLMVLVPVPAAITAPVRRPSIAAPPITAATLRHTAPTDSALQALTAANARYARQAQERTAREVAQAQALARLQKQLANRAAAQRRLSIAQAAAAAKASAATRLGLPAEPSDSTATEPDMAVGPTPDQPTSPTSRPTRERARRSAESARLAQQSQESTPLAPVAPESTTTLVEPAEAASPRRAARLAGTIPVDEPRRSGPAVASRSKQEAGAPTTYTVRSNDNLSKLAQEYEVSLAQLKAWNNLRTETLIAGQQLRLTAPATATVAAEPAHTARRLKATPSSLKLEMHTVEPGDTLFNISKRFGVSVEELRRLNHLASDQVKLGQKLLVRG